MKTKLPVSLWILLLLFHFSASAQVGDLIAILHAGEGKVSHLLFTGNGAGMDVNEAFLARQADLNDSYPHLTVSGDFNGDGRDETAFLGELFYNPNMVPDFTRSIVWVSRSQGGHFLPAGSWFSVPDSSLDFDHVDFSVADDFNGDGFCDIALFYNDPDSDQLAIYVLQSGGTVFSGPLEWYTCNRSEFNFNALRFACGGDFNGNGRPDIAVFYNYFGTAPGTRQSVFLFESAGSSFSLLPRAYDATKASYDFTQMKFALPGDYDLDDISDLAVLHEDPAEMDLKITVFEGSAGGQLSPVDYNSFQDTDPFLGHVLQATGAHISGDPATDLVLFYDNPGNGRQEILILESGSGTFQDPDIALSVERERFAMEDVTHVQGGDFSFRPVVSAATWKNDHRGALSFTFDDGYKGAFEHGGAELDAAGLKGTFYVFTDTSALYDGEPASTALIREYKDKGHEIASHTSNHSNLGYLTEAGDLDSLDRVLSISRELLNERFDQYTMTMSIPFGSFLYESLEHISSHFYSARSSQFGFNLATPFDFYALRSWPVLSTTSPDLVDSLFSLAEEYGTYLPLMYHDMLDEPFDEDQLIYTYSRELFRETVQDGVSRDLWIDTHARIYKYIRERNAVVITVTEDMEKDPEGGSYSFTADDGLADSIFDVALSLKIAVPGTWAADTVTVGPENRFSYLEVIREGNEGYVLYDWVPVSDIPVFVHEGVFSTTGVPDRNAFMARVKLAAYPNPFRQETRIQVTGNYRADYYLVIRDIHGRIIRNMERSADDSYLISRSFLEPGIYIIQLISGKESLASLKLLAL